ncbi:MAG: LytR/AlgR family response regulator transcription factor [Pseudobdellovibrionaceae bacterium]
MKILLVDDENPARERLKRLILKNSSFSIAGESSNGIQALELVESLKPDAVFLDIEMPELGGIEVASAIGGLSFAQPHIVFVTAFSEFAVKAFDLNALDYIVKPINESRLVATLEKLKKQNKSVEKQTHGINQLAAEDTDKKFALKAGAKFVVCDPKKIVAILAKDHYSALIIEGKELLSEESLDSLGQRLNRKMFLRVHRSGIINLTYLKELEREGDRKYRAVLDDVNKTKVPISRDKLEEVKTLFKI